MAKINYTKVEQELNEALRVMYTKKLMQGEPSVSQRAVSYYGMDSGERPKPRDAVVDELEAIEEEAEFLRQEIERMRKVKMMAQKGKEGVLGGLQAFAENGVILDEEGEHLEYGPAPMADKAPAQEQKPDIKGQADEKGPSQPVKEDIPTIDEAASKLPPLLLIRRLILWMRKKRVVDLYRLLGTSEEEMVALRDKEKLTPKDEERVKELLEKGKQLKVKLMKKLGLEDDQKIVSKEYKKNKTKRFNVKDTWLPM